MLCHPSHTYCCTWPTVTKALAMPTNSNAHVLPVGSKVMRCSRGVHCEYVHLVTKNTAIHLLSIFDTTFDQKQNPSPW